MKRFAVLSSAVATLGVAAIAATMVLGSGGAHAATSPVSGVTANVVTGSLHGMKPFHGAKTTPARSRTSNLTYHGGPIEQAPKIYIVWWGSQWGTGFSTGGYTSAQAQTYMTDFYSNVGGTSWDNINTQYCQGVAKGTVNCGTSGTHITNPTGQLAGTWTDTADAVPSSPTQSQIASEAIIAASHFGGDNTNATYFVFTPTGHSQSGFGTQWCAYHSEVADGSSPLAFAYMPYIPDAAGSCGENFVNATNDSYGNGYFDGFSVVGGHEYSEAETDPYTATGHYAWLDSSGNEIGDKCAWSSLSTNITLSNGHFYAVQPLWSNAKSGCALSY